MLKAIAILLPSSTPAACMSRSSAEIWSSSTNTRRSPAWVKSTCAAKNVADVTRCAPLLGEPRQRRGEQGAADAIAGGVDLHLARHLLDDVHRGERALLHVVVERLLAEFLVRIDPGDHEHGDALVDAPFDVGFFRLEIENVELVDPGRHDQERRAQHGLRGRRVLDQLHQLVLEDHLAGRRRHVDADDEIGRVGLADAQRAVAGLDVLRQHLHAAHEIVAVGGQRLAQHFRIGEDEIRRRHRVGDLLDVEFGLLARMRIEAVGVLHQRFCAHCVVSR